MILQNNQINIIGKVISKFSFSLEMDGEKFYIMQLQVLRLSNAFDALPVMVSDRLLDVSEILEGKWLQVNGQIRSFNLHEFNSSKLLLSVFAIEIFYAKDEAND